MIQAAVFFADGGTASIDGMLASLGLVGGIVIACCPLVRLLPRAAQPQDH